MKLLPLIVGPKFHPYVEVTVGKKLVTAVWDTGASITVVDTQFIKSNADMFDISGKSIGTDATGTSQTTPSFIMKTHSIGGHEFSPTEVVGVDLSHINSSTEIPMTMILGYTTLCKANWLFDFPQKYWTITKMC